MLAQVYHAQMEYLVTIFIMIFIVRAQVALLVKRVNCVGIGIHVLPNLVECMVCVFGMTQRLHAIVQLDFLAIYVQVQKF